VPYPQLIRFPEPVSGDVRGRHRDWLEAYGETMPAINWGTVKAPANGGLYEYRWAFGYSKAFFSDPRPKTGSRWRGRKRKRSHSERLDYPAAHARLFLAAGCNCRVSEILATVKHLSPVPEEQTWREALAKDFTAIAPVIGIAGKAAADGAKWFVRRIDRVWSKSLFRGIEWELSLGLLLQLGARVTGGLLTSFASVGGD
jgi:hypothetical protein